MLLLLVRRGSLVVDLLLLLLLLLLALLLLDLLQLLVHGAALALAEHPRVHGYLLRLGLHHLLQGEERERERERDDRLVPI